jgi:hypothetical protein
MSNKLTFEQVEKYFYNEYPQGNIYHSEDVSYNYKISVAYTKSGKVYSYVVKNYIELVEKLKLNVNLMYKNTYNKLIEEETRLKKQIELKGQERGFGKKRHFELYNEEELQQKINQLNEIEKDLKNATII